MISINDSLEQESWDYLAQITLSFTVEFDSDNYKTRKIKKEVEMIKRAIYDHFTNSSIESNYLNSMFLVKLMKTISKLEASFSENNARGNEFIIFLKSLANRIKKKKLIIDKPFERVKEFNKLKSLSENGHGVF